MPKRKSPQKFAMLGEKDCWHSYSLQMLAPSKFNKVVGKILRGNYSLVTSQNRLDGGPQHGFPT
jgi:hypothetical protein